MIIKELSEVEIPLAIDMVWSVFQEFEAPDYPQQGVEEFRDFLNNSTELSKLIFYGAMLQNEIVGVIAMRKSHISLFFVKKQFHRNGIGKKLFKYVLKHLNNNEITVNSSPYAQFIYQSLGFSPTDKQQITNGIIYIPMKYIQGK